MIKPLGAVFTAALALVATAVQAAAPEVYLAIYADHTVPYVEPADGGSHAFLCLSKTTQVTPQDLCFGFFPRPEAVTSITLARGDSLKRTEQDWVESPSGFHFIQQPSPADNIVLFDASRQMTWRLSSPRGGSVLEESAGKQPWLPVRAITFGADAPAFIGGNNGPDQYEETVSPPLATNVTYQRAITAAQREAVLSAVADWNAGQHRLNQAGYIDAIAGVGARLGLKLPRQTRRQTAADYLDALSRLN